MTDSGSERRRRAILWGGLLVVLAALALLWIFSTEPTAQRSGATKQTAMLVDVVEARRGTYRPRLVTTGTVQAAQELVLRPRVSGAVKRIAPELEPGSFVREGATLVELSRADYQNALLQHKSQLTQARAELTLELGRQDVAKHDLAVLRNEPSPEQRALILREPQLAAARGRVAAARAGVAQARLDLQRTTIEAPFHAQVISRAVSVGSQVAAGDELARLLGVERFRIVAALPLSQRRWLSIPDSAGERGSPVELRNRSTWPKGVSRQGFVTGMVGALDEDTRLARVVISVPDPLARHAQSEAAAPPAEGAGKVPTRTVPPLVVGEFLEVAIVGNPIEDVVRLQREYLRANDTVWLMRDAQLHVAEVEVALEDEQYAYVTRGLSAGDRIVTTQLATVRDGVKLRTQPDESSLLPGMGSNDGPPEAEAPGTSSGHGQ